MKPYHLMNTQEMAEARNRDPVAFQAMIDEIDKAKPEFDANGQIKFVNGQLVQGTRAQKFTNGEVNQNPNAMTR